MTDTLIIRRRRIAVERRSPSRAEPAARARADGVQQPSTLFSMGKTPPVDARPIAEEVSRLLDGGPIRFPRELRS
jgi:hypothetical protein